MLRPFRRLKGLFGHLLVEPVSTAAGAQPPQQQAIPGQDSALAAASPSGIRVLPMTGTFGAKLENVDLAQGQLSAEGLAQIKEALSSYKVVVIDGQDHISPTELADFAENWGKAETEPHMGGRGHNQEEDKRVYIIRPEDPKFKKNGYTPPMGVKVETSWHRDGPPRRYTQWYSFLHAKDVPPYGMRDTLFADMEAAFERLSPSLQEYLGSLTAMNDWGVPVKGYDGPHAHPVIMTDPDNGRKSVFVDRQYTRKINGLRKEESDWMLKFLWDLTDIPELQCRVSWKPGTLLLWDNEKTQHYLVRDQGYDRILHRVMVNTGR